MVNQQGPIQTRVSDHESRCVFECCEHIAGEIDPCRALYLGNDQNGVARIVKLCFMCSALMESYLMAKLLAELPETADSLTDGGSDDVTK